MSLMARFRLLAVAAVALAVGSVLLFHKADSFEDLIVPALFAVVGAVSLASLLARGPISDLMDMREVARSLSRGQSAVDLPLTLPAEIGGVATELRHVGEHLSAKKIEFEREESLLTSLVDALDQGVVSVSERSWITRINAAARSMLGVSAEVPFSSDLLPRSRELREALTRALEGTPTEPTEIVLNGRTISMTARPLHVGGGVLIALFDLTSLRKLETVRRDFVANVSHELRTPLTVIAGFAETLAEDEPPPPLRQQFAATIRDHTDRMRRIVEELLNLSRLESGGWQPERTEIDLREIASEIAASFLDRAAHAGVELRTAIDDDARAVVADPTAMRQVLFNLVDNALRHTERGSVTIFATREVNELVLGVRDTGAGISEKHQARIFERFYRADEGRARDKGGTGLGLAIVKHLVNAHGGTTRVESVVGQGTSVIASLPVTHDTAPL